MRHTDLPAPGALSNGLKLRVEVASAVSYVERQASRRPKVVPAQLVTLRTFLNAAVTRLTQVETVQTAP